MAANVQLNVAPAGPRGIGYHNSLEGAGSYVLGALSGIALLHLTTHVPFFRRGVGLHSPPPQAVIGDVLSAAPSSSREADATTIIVDTGRSPTTLSLHSRGKPTISPNRPLREIFGHQGFPFTTSPANHHPHHRVNGSPPLSPKPTAQASPTDHYHQPLPSDQRNMLYSLFFTVVCTTFCLWVCGFIQTPPLFDRPARPVKKETPQTKELVNQSSQTLLTDEVADYLDSDGTKFAIRQKESEDARNQKEITEKRKRDEASVWERIHKLENLLLEATTKELNTKKERDSLKDEVVALKDRDQAKDEVIDRLTVEKTKIVPLQATIDRFKKEADDARKKTQEMVQDHRRTCEAMQTALQESYARQDSLLATQKADNARLEELRSHVNGLEAEMEGLVDKVAELTEKASNAEYTAAQLVTAQHRILSLETERDSAISEKEKVSTQLIDLRKELDALQQASHAPRSDDQLATLHSALEEKEAAFKAADREHERLQARLSEQEAQIKDLTALANHTVSYQSKLQDTVAEKQKLATELSLLRKELDAAQKAFKAPRSDEEVTSLRVTLRKQDATIRTKIGDIKILKADNEKLESQVQAMTAESKLHQSCSTIFAQLKSEVRRLSAELGDERKKVSSLEKGTNAGKEANALLAQERTKVAGMEKDLEQLRQALKKKEADHENVVKNYVSLTTGLNNDLTAKMATISDQHKKLENLQKEVMDLKAQAAKSGDNTELKEMVAFKDQQVLDMAQTIQNLEKEAKEANASSEKAISEFRKSVTEKEQAVKTLEQDLKNLRNELDAANTKGSAAQDETLNQLHNVIGAKDLEMEAQQQELESHKVKVQQLLRAHNDKDETIVNLNKVIHGKDLKIQDQENRISGLQSQLKFVAGQDPNADLVTELKATVHMQEAQLKQLTQENGQLRSENETGKNREQRLMQEGNSLQSQYDDLLKSRNSEDTTMEDVDRGLEEKFDALKRDLDAKCFELDTQQAGVQNALIQNSKLESVNQTLRQTLQKRDEAHAEELKKLRDANEELEAKLRLQDQYHKMKASQPPLTSISPTSPAMAKELETAQQRSARPTYGPSLYSPSPTSTASPGYGSYSSSSSTTTRPGYPAYYPSSMSTVRPGIPPYSPSSTPTAHPGYAAADLSPKTPRPAPGTRDTSAYAPGTGWLAPNSPSTPLFKLPGLGNPPSNLGPMDYYKAQASLYSATTPSNPNAINPADEMRAPNKNGKRSGPDVFDVDRESKKHLDNGRKAFAVPKKRLPEGGTAGCPMPTASSPLLQLDKTAGARKVTPAGAKANPLLSTIPEEGEEWEAEVFQYQDELGESADENDNLGDALADFAERMSDDDDKLSDYLDDPVDPNAPSIQPQPSLQQFFQPQYPVQDTSPIVVDEVDLAYLQDEYSPIIGQDQDGDEDMI